MVFTIPVCYSHTHHAHKNSRVLYCPVAGRMWGGRVEYNMFRGGIFFSCLLMISSDTNSVTYIFRDEELVNYDNVMFLIILNSSNQS